MSLPRYGCLGGDFQKGAVLLEMLFHEVNGLAVRFLDPPVLLHLVDGKPSVFCPGKAILLFAGVSAERYLTEGMVVGFGHSGGYGFLGYVRLGALRDSRRLDSDLVAQEVEESLVRVGLCVREQP